MSMLEVVSVVSVVSVVAAVLAGGATPLGIVDQDHWASRWTSYLMPRYWPPAVSPIHDLDQLDPVDGRHVVAVEHDHRTGQLTVICSDGTVHVVDHHVQSQRPAGRRRHTPTRQGPSR